MYTPEVPNTVQLAIEAAATLACLVGYAVEAKRGERLRDAPPRPVPRPLRAKVIGEGDWVVLGMSEEDGFENMRATPELTSSGFVLEMNGRRVEVARGTKVRIEAVAGARRAPVDAITTTSGVKPRYSFELQPGTELFTDLALPDDNPYRAGQTDAPVLLAGSAAVLAKPLPSTAFAGCWLMVLFSTVLASAVLTMAGLDTVAWIGIVASALLLFLAWMVLPDAPPR
jgi:hypothetical protein